MTNELISVLLNSAANIDELIMPRPSDWHAHVRQAELLAAVAPVVMRPYKYLLVMPNNGYDGRPVETLHCLHRYSLELSRLRDEYGFSTELVMTIYFTKKLTPAIVYALKKLPFRVEVKYYPPEQGATTGSGFGMTLEEGRETLLAMQDCGIPLLGHFESVTDNAGNVLSHLEREGYFAKERYPRLRDMCPTLRISVEHGSTEEFVNIVTADHSGNTVMTVTPHHLLFLLSEIFGNSWRNHGRCMPYIKDDPRHRAALQQFVFSGDRRAIAGADTAPHVSRTKEGEFEKAACGCWLPHAIGLYIMAAKQANALNDDFVHFMCYNGADWRSLPRPEAHETIKVVGCESPFDIPEPLVVPGLNDVVIPLGWTTADDRLQIGHALADQMHCSH
jgi:dihydroorotase